MKMICVIALIVFGIIGIFSASYRIIAKEAADCVFRRLTLRKCETGLDKRLKNQITGKIARKKPKLAKFLFKNFEIISWILLILLVWSIVQSGIGLYNLAAYGNCNGPLNEGFCIFNPTGSLAQYSGIQMEFPEQKILPSHADDPFIGPEDAELSVIIFGCYSCPFTKKAEPTIKKLISEYSDRVKFVFKEFPLPKHAGSMEAAISSHCAYKYNKYFEARDFIFSNQEKLNQPGFYEELAQSLGIKPSTFIECMNSPEIKQEVLVDVEEGVNAHVYGTPAVFINDNIFVGPKDYKVYKATIEQALQ